MTIKYLMYGSAINDEDDDYCGSLRQVIKYMNSINRYKEMGITILDIRALLKIDTGRSYYYTAVCKIQEKDTFSDHRINIEEELMEKMFRKDKLDKLIRGLKMIV